MKKVNIGTFTKIIWCMIFSTKQYEGVAIQCKHFDKAIHEELQLHGQNPQVFVRWKSKKPFRVGSGDTFSFLANPSTLFSQDSFPPKNFDTKTHMVVCFSSASPPRFLFIWHLLMFDKEAGDQVDYQHCGCCLWSWHFSLGLGFFGCLVLPVVGRMNSCTVFAIERVEKGPQKQWLWTGDHIILSSVLPPPSSWFLWPVFSGVCVPPQNEKTNEFDFTSFRTTPFVLISVFWSCSR